MADPDKPKLALLAGLLAGSMPAREENYFEALGRFVTSYAQAEAAVHILVRKLSGMQDERARIVFSGMRLGEMADRARQLFRLDITPFLFGLGIAKPRTQADYDHLDATLIQLDKISGVRGELVHRMVNYMEHGFVVTNSLTAKTLANIETRTVTLSELRAMQSDCTRIFLRLHWAADRSSLIGGDFDEAAVEAVLNRRWLYTPREPSAPKKPRPKRGKSRRRQRGPSWE